MRTRLLRLPDTRLMEYAEFGDPEGMPVMFFHGFMGSCEQGILAHRFAGKEAVRIIAPNRPGIGRSSPATFKVMTEYAHDILALADHLSIDTFTIVGASGGGCFALACGHDMPKRVKLVGVIGGIGPLSVINNIQQMTWVRRVFLQGCHGYPVTARWLLASFFHFCRKWPQLSYNWLVRSSSVIEAQMTSRKDVAEILWRDHQNVFLQRNGVEGLLLEAGLYFHWGFDLKNFPEETHVLFWHGKEDSVVPWATIRHMAKPIPYSRGIVCPGGHLTFLMNQTDEVLQRIKTEWHETQPRFVFRLTP